MRRLGRLHQVPPMREVIAHATPHGCRTTLYPEHLARVMVARAAQRIARCEEAAPRWDTPLARP